jgi:ABC-type multidrug transport system fused ATPase/permease subunit
VSGSASLSLAAGRTAVFVSHRFSTVRAADRIAVLDQGRLVEQGSHEALIRARGLYARVWEGLNVPVMWSSM